MAIYRELFFNNVEGFLSNTFPVSKQVLGEEAWQRLARDFFARHRCHSPLFLEIPREFLTHLEAMEKRGSVSIFPSRGPEATDKAEEKIDTDPFFSDLFVSLPFLRELAHYEWVELALSVSEASDPPCDPDADLLDTRPVPAGTAWPFAYRFPVHRIGPDFQPLEPPSEPTYLLVYRDGDDEVGFLELNAVSARLFALLQEDGTASGRELLEKVAAELNHPAPDVVVDGGLGILREWHAKGIVSGGR
jgi:hypothetical protein